MNVHGETLFLGYITALGVAASAHPVCGHGLHLGHLWVSLSACIPEHRLTGSWKTLVSCSAAPLPWGLGAGHTVVTLQLMRPGSCFLEGKISVRRQNAVKQECSGCSRSTVRTVNQGRKWRGGSHGRAQAGLLSLTGKSEKGVSWRQVQGVSLGQAATAHRSPVCKSGGVP